MKIIDCYKEDGVWNALVEFESGKRTVYYHWRYSKLMKALGDLRAVTG